MIEIILGVWIISMALSLISVGINFYLVQKKLESKKLEILNLNLEKINLYWSNTTEDFLPLEAEGIKRDKQKTLRNALLLSLFGLGSLPGFILLVVVILSIHFLAPSRKTKATFSSPLAFENLSAAEVESFVKDLKQIH